MAALRINRRRDGNSLNSASANAGAGGVGPNGDLYKLEIGQDPRGNVGGDPRIATSAVGVGH